jgi:disulfide bond formation protein DsbB
MPRFVERSAPRTTAIATALFAGIALGAAFAMEDWGGLVPCALCLLERWPYRIVIGLGILAAITPRGLSRALLWLAVVCLLGDVVLGVIHVGVEFHWWPSPLPECAAPHVTGATLAERLASMPARPAKPCDEPNFLIPGVPISIAGGNLIYALAFAVILAAALGSSRNRRR